MMLREKNARIEPIDLADILHGKVIVADTVDSDHDGVTPTLKLSSMFDLYFNPKDLNDPHNGIKVYGRERRARQLEFDGKDRRVAPSYLDGVIAEIAKTAERTKSDGSVFVVVSRYDAMPDGYWTEYRKKEFAIRVAFEAAKYDNAVVVLMGPDKARDKEVAQRLNVPYVTVDDWAGLERAVSAQLTKRCREMEQAGYVPTSIPSRPLRVVNRIKPYGKPLYDPREDDARILARYAAQRRAESQAALKNP